ncbi:MAG TPA: hypothetical protein VMZ52_20300 [Bryobacteraceae bacterium]|nr:hypothetical protein [Bryobacteraceae bacterium]
MPVHNSKPSLLAQKASNFILKNRDEPWMLYVNTLEPHTPFTSVLNTKMFHGERPASPEMPRKPLKK